MRWVYKVISLCMVMLCFSDNAGAQSYMKPWAIDYLSNFTSNLPKGRNVSTYLIKGKYTVGRNIISYSDDTVLLDDMPYVIFRPIMDIASGYASGYAFYGLNGIKLIEVSRSPYFIYINEKAGYIVSFLNNSRKSLVLRDDKFPNTLVNEIVRFQLIDRGITINEQAEERFIRFHPLPGK